jgi:glycosyltransferase involved in cell wall biosynthesis
MLPVLTIAIPTYNRSTTLDLLLQSILNQSSTDVEVLILDNASEDDTKKVVAKYEGQIHRLRYIKHEANIGSDKNFIECFKTASSDYVWIVGDDELLFSGSINCVKKIISDCDFGCAYLSSEAVFLEKLHTYLDCHAGICSPVFFKQWDFAKFINYRLTFLSGTVVNKRALLEKYENFYEYVERFSGSSLVHLSWVCSAINSRQFSIYIDTPLFASTVANSGGYNPVKVFIENLGDIYEYFFYHIGKNQRRTINFLTLIGWFPKVSYDVRFSKKYQKGPHFNINDFPNHLKVGVIWFLFKSISSAPKPFAFIHMVFLKAIYKFFIYYLRLTKAVKHVN